VFTGNNRKKSEIFKMTIKMSDNGLYIIEFTNKRVTSPLFKFFIINNFYLAS